PAVQQLGQDEHVQLALVVEQEDGGPGREVLGAADVQPDPGQHTAQLTSQGGAEVDGLPPGTHDRPERRARGESAEHPGQPRRRGTGPPGRPVTVPFTISTGDTRMCSTPIALAAGSTWNRVAEEASTTVCPARRCASTSRHPSGYSAPEMPCTNSRSPSSVS